MGHYPLPLVQKEAAGFPVFTGEYNLNTVVERLDWVPDVFSDLYHLIYQVKGRWVWHRWPCCTVPSARYLHDPLHPDGTAILQAGHHTASHELGWHPSVEARPRRRALVARRALPVWRDPNLDGVVDPYHTPGVAYGINVHSGSVLAGCIGLPGPAMEELLYLVQLAVPHQGEDVSLTLLDPE